MIYPDSVNTDGRVTSVSTSPKIKRRRGATRRSRSIRLPLRFCDLLHKSGNAQSLFIPAPPHHFAVCLHHRHCQYCRLSLSFAYLLTLLIPLSLPRGYGYRHAIFMRSLPRRYTGCPKINETHKIANKYVDFNPMVYIFQI